MRTSAAHSHLRLPLTRMLDNGGNVRVLRALMTRGSPLGRLAFGRRRKSPRKRIDALFWQVRLTMSLKNACTFNGRS